MKDASKQGKPGISLDELAGKPVFVVPDGFHDAQAQSLMRIPAENNSGRIRKLIPVYALAGAAAAIILILLVSVVSLQINDNRGMMTQEQLFEYLLGEHVYAYDPYLSALVYDAWEEEELSLEAGVNGLPADEITDYLNENADYEDIIDY